MAAVVRRRAWESLTSSPVATSSHRGDGQRDGPQVAGLLEQSPQSLLPPHQPRLDRMRPGRTPRVSQSNLDLRNRQALHVAPDQEFPIGSAESPQSKLQVGLRLRCRDAVFGDEFDVGQVQNSFPVLLSPFAESRRGCQQDTPREGTHVSDGLPDVITLHELQSGSLHDLWPQGFVDQSAESQ